MKKKKCFLRFNGVMWFLCSSFSVHATPPEAFRPRSAVSHTAWSPFSSGHDNGSFLPSSGPQLLKASEFKLIKRMPTSSGELSFDAAESSLQCLPAAHRGAHQSHSFTPPQSPSAASTNFPSPSTSSKSSFLETQSRVNMRLFTNPVLLVISAR